MLLLLFVIYIYVFYVQELERVPGLEPFEKQYVMEMLERFQKASYVPYVIYFESNLHI